MKFISTRDKNYRVGAAEAIKQGISPDGGLFVPEEFPKVDLGELLGLGFKALSAKILSLYLTDYTKEELAGYAEAAYSADKWGGENTCPTVRLGAGLSVCELWHGPTCAFKDVALQMLPHLLTAACRKTGEQKTVVILVATSGDTGKAALDGFKDVDGTRIIVFYPVDGVSRIQKLQMTTQEGGNVRVAAISGNFDNAQSGVKEIFSDSALEKRLADAGFMFSSANSINFGRLVPQIVYYFSSYFDLVRAGEIKLGDGVDFCVPTGNFGDILAGFYAKQMGLPVEKLVCASNENNVLTDFINTGVYDKNRPFYLTTSPSMDILVSSNLERLLFHLSDGGDAAIRGYMAELKNNGKYSVSDKIKTRVKQAFAADFCNSAQGAAAIGEIYAKHRYVCDTHTSVAACVARRRLASGESSKIIVMSTANPFKFSEAVLKGLGVAEKLDEFEQIERLENFGIAAPPQLAELKTKEIRFKTVCEPRDMAAEVTSYLLGK